MGEPARETRTFDTLTRDLLVSPTAPVIAARAPTMRCPSRQVTITQPRELSQVTSSAAKGVIPPRLMAASALLQK